MHTTIVTVKWTPCGYLGKTTSFPDMFQKKKKRKNEKPKSKRPPNNQQSQRAFQKEGNWTNKAILDEKAWSRDAMSAWFNGGEMITFAN